MITLKSKSNNLHDCIKDFLFFFLESDNNIKQIHKEKVIKDKKGSKRRADIFVELEEGKKIVIEIQCSYISVKEIYRRIKFYSRLGIHVLFCLCTKGKILISPKKKRKNKRNVKISPQELYLHNLYFSNVVYIEVRKSNRKVKHFIFALKFTPCKNKGLGKVIKGYERFYYRDAWFKEIRTLEIRCLVFNGVRLAYFRDMKRL